ncbi:predicted protein [Nematostella vectensis]|uniref:SH3 domain-containing protein n=1 Tax=Nematostella vectensis TaxID=45351 RepID=A7RGP6_NEMVE|nr:predicted protein [Nematostella vectensis]|eukprot:XP_001641638.1 predicted protein [Nematostella vectensis]
MNKSCIRTLAPKTCLEEVEVETDEEVEEVIEREVTQDVVQMVSVPQVQVLYLIAKTNKDWWSVRRTKSREAGYVPANYVVEIEPKAVKKVTKKTTMVPEKVMVKRKVKKMVTLKEPSGPSSQLKRREKRRGVQRHFTAHFDRDNVAVRQITISNTYNRLIETSEMRRLSLQKAIKYYHFCHECEDMDLWMSNKTLAPKTCSEEVEVETGEVELVVRHPRQARQIKAKEGEVIGLWAGLKSKANKRKGLLDEAYGQQGFLVDARDLMSWSAELKESFISAEDPQDIASASELIQQHEEKFDEIQTRFERFDQLDEYGRNLLATSPQAVQVKQSMAALKAEKAALSSSWAKRNDRLHQGLDLQTFIRDAEHVDAVTASQETFLAKEDLGFGGWIKEKSQIAEDESFKDPKNLQGNLKRHKAFEAEITANKDGIDRINKLRFGSTLVVGYVGGRTKSREAGYVPANYVVEIEPKAVKKVTKKTTMVPEKVMVKRKVKKMVTLKEPSGPSSQLKRREKRRGVQRHFTAHFDRDNVAVRQITITNTYNRLIETSEMRRLSLQKAIKYYHFCHECEDMDLWMSNKERQFKSIESQNTLDAIQTVRQKLERFATEIATKCSRVSDINQLADELIQDGHAHSAAVKAKRKEINERWEKLQRLKVKEEENLAEKHGVELFLDVCEEMRSWIQEKDAALCKEELGKDIETVRAQLRRHQGIERDLAAVEDKVAKLQDQAKSLVVRHPRQARQIKAKEGEVISLWAILKSKANKRKGLLDEAYGQQGFLADARDLMSWSAELKESFISAEDPQDIASASELIQQHEEKFDEIQTRFERFDQLDEYGRNLLATSPQAVQVKQSMAALKAEKAALSSSWAKRNDRLHQGLDLQSSVDEVEWLLKKHEDFVKTLTAQEEKVRSLADMAKTIIHARHQARDWVASRAESVINRRDNVKNQASDRQKALLTSQVLQNFIRDADEFGGWIKEKSQIAEDESFKDPKNLQGNLKRHKAFEAEITANKDGIDRINKAGKDLIRTKHFGAQKVKDKLKGLNEAWLNLVADTTEKGNKLQQAERQRQLNRAMEDVRIWMNETEAVLGLEDTGRDLAGVKFLTKKHQLLESDIEMHATVIVDVADKAQELVSQGHFNSDTIKSDSENLQSRYRSLLCLTDKRRSVLEDAFALHQFIYDIEVEMTWVREHLQQASSGDLGTSLISVQRLQKRHLAFENELTNHQTRIDTVLSSGQDLIDSCYSATDKVEERCEELQNLWDELVDMAAQRKQRLHDSFLSQKYLSEANEADSWMNDKAGLAASQDYGKDGASAETLLTRHKALQVDVAAFSTTIDELAEEARRLVQSSHFDSEKISSTQRDLEEQFCGLNTLVKTRHTRLTESKKLHEYRREVEEISAYVSEQLQTAASEDYGTDFEHLQVIQGRFGDFQRSVASYAENFRNVDNLAKMLVSEGHTDTVAIKEQQDITRSMWLHLEDQIRLRQKRLTSAEEIHRFNRDLNELISRIQEKDAAINLEDLGRDLASTQVLQRKHEVFECELVTLEKQIEELTVESARLQATYQGQTARSVEQHEKYVLSLWEELKRKTSRKRRKLHDAYEFYKLGNTVRDLISWCIETSRLIASDDPVHTVSDAERMMRELDEHHAEMDAREESFARVLETGEKMIEDGHFAEEEITDKLELLLSERERLYASWDTRKEELSEAYYLHVFLKDAKQVDSFTSSQEAVLLCAELGNSVDEVEFLLKKHENTEKLVLSQEEKLSALQVLGKELIDNQHNQSDMIRNRLSGVCDRREKLKAELDKRREKLQNSHKIMQFYQDVVESESWIMEKLQTATDESFKDPINLESKLQKHQAFESELTAHERAIDSVRDKGEQLISCGHFAASEVEVRIEALYIQWEELLEASATKGRKLQEARDHQQFNQEVDIADSCITDKETIVLSSDYGRDFEHCVRLQRKMKEFDQDLAVDAARVEAINVLAEKLIGQGHAGSVRIQQRQNALTERWNRLQDKASERRQKLAEACEIHAFNRNCRDVSSMINEKAAVQTSGEVGRDLPAVEALIRKHDDVERELTVIEGKMEELEGEAYRLVRSQPHMARAVQAKQADIIEQWERLNDLFDQRKVILEANRLLQIFLVDYRDLMSWMNDLGTRMSSGELADNVRDAEAMLGLHEERKGQMNARMDSYNATVAFGMSLVEQGHVSADVIKQNVDDLVLENTELQQLWQSRKLMLQQSTDLQMFLADAEKAENWIKNKQMVAQSIESRESLDNVESLLKSHINFEKSLSTYEENIRSLESSAKQFLQVKHYHAEAIRSKYLEILDKWEALKKLAASRSGKLGESKLLFQFLRDAKELESWMNEKLQIAAEASYREATNLQQKLQKHQTFEAEVSAHKSELDAITQTGQSLMRNSPSCQETVESRLKDLADLWSLLGDLSDNKAQRLKEAIQKQTFERNVIELQAWIEEVENALASEDYGKDMRSVNNLIKRHQSLQMDIARYEDRVSELLKQAGEFVAAEHFLKDEIADRAADVAERFEQLVEPATERELRLQDSLALHQFLADTQVEVDWIKDKEPIAKSEDYGRNLLGVQSLMKKMEGLESEINSHELLVQALLETGEQLVLRGHYAERDIGAKSQMLLELWEELRINAQTRNEKLQASLATHQYYDQVFEMDAWVSEKLSLVSSTDYGRDETSAETLLRKHDALQLELDANESKIRDLRSIYSELSDAGDTEFSKLEKIQDELEERYTHLRDVARDRHRRLLDSSRLFNFLREADELGAWVEEKEAIVSSDDCGRDLEHVEMLMQKFEVFTRDLVSSGERIAKLTEHAQMLLDDEHTDSEMIEQRAEVICERWDGLKERTSTRLEELDRARDLHAFRRSVDEIHAWIQEKIDALGVAENGAPDLRHVQALQRKHQGFQRDLQALGEKVDLVLRDADDLSAKVPAHKHELIMEKQEVQKAWKKLQQLASSKQSHLLQSEGLQAFLDDYRDLMSWIETTSAQVAEETLGSTFADVETLIAQNQELQTEIDSRANSVEEFQSRADQLLGSGNPSAEDIRNKSSHVRDTWDRLGASLRTRTQQLQHNKEIQRFKREADQLEAWLNAREHDLLSEDVGDSLEAVEELLKKQDEFEKMLLTQGEKFNSLTNTSFSVHKKSCAPKQVNSEEARTVKAVTDSVVAKPGIDVAKEIPEQMNGLSEVKESKSVSAESMDSFGNASAARTSSPFNAVSPQRQLDSSDKASSTQTSSPFKAVLPQRPINTADEVTNLINASNLKSSLSESPAEKEQVRSPLEFDPGPKEIQKTLVVLEGMLRRRQELQTAGRNAGSNIWQNLYSVLIDKSLLFYGDKKSFSGGGNQVSPQIELRGSRLHVEEESTNHEFRLLLPDGSQFLFRCKDVLDFHRWTNEIEASTNDGEDVQSNGGHEKIETDQISPMSLDKVPPYSQLASDDVIDYGDGEVISEEDILAEFYPDAPLDFNDNSIDNIPAPPLEFDGLDEGDVDDDLTGLPVAPPPPVPVSTEVEPMRPPRKMRAPPPPSTRIPDVRYRSSSQDSRDSDELPDILPPPKPPIKPKPKVPEDKRHKPKGVFGIFKKKK